jgi:hypothetical protein
MINTTTSDNDALNNMPKNTSELNKMNVKMLRALCVKLGLPIIRTINPGSRRRPEVPAKDLRENIKNNLGLKGRVQTEDLGLILEKAICISQNIEYVGEFKYSLEKANTLALRLGKLQEFITEPLTHTAQGQGKYDFTGKTIRLSAKSNKTHHKVAPQTVGQPTKKRFCELFGLAPELAEPMPIKGYILNNIRDMLPIYFENTFDCSVLYYHEKENTLKFIKAINPIDWSNKNITFSQNTVESWNEGSTLYIEIEPGITKTIGEFQLHNHRNGVKFRWDIRNLLHAFPEHFTIHSL